MKKLFLLSTLTILIFACSNESSISEPPVSSSIKNYSYYYNGEVYNLRFDVSDEDNALLLQGKDNEILSKIYEDNEELSMVVINDSIYHLFNSLKDYEESSLYAENERKSRVYKNQNYNKSGVDAKSSVSAISETVPGYPNFNKEIYLYVNKDYIFNIGGYYISFASGTTFSIADFSHLTNYGGYGAGPGYSLFPLSLYNQQYGNLNDAISSVYVNLAKITLFEHPNFGGRTLILDARSGPTYYVKISNLKDVKYSCGFLCKRNWNDRLSSASFQF